MQIKQFLKYFATNTFVVIKSIRYEEGTKNIHTLLSMPIEELMDLQGYYDSILNKNIGDEQVSVQGNTLYIDFID